MPRMPSKTTALKYGVGILCYALTIIIVAVVRFTHIDMTETQLLINFWWVWLPAGLFAVLGSWIIGK